MTRRLKLILAAVTLIAAAFATGGVASAQKGAGCGPGNLRCTDDVTDANGFWQPNDPNVFFAQISPFRGTFSFAQHGVGPPVVQHSTIVSIQIDGSQGFGFGCFVVPDSAFVVGSDLQTATLSTTVTADETCPGFAQPVISGPGGSAGFQPGGGIPLPLTVNLTWTGPGAAFSSTSDTVSHCVGTTETIHFSGEQTQARATGTLTLPDSTVVNLGTTQFGFVESFHQALNQTGQPAPQCSLS